MRFLHTLLAAALMLVGAQTATAQSQNMNLTRADVEAIVQEYIEKNGDKLMSSIIASQQKQQLARAATAINPNTPVMGPANAPVTIIEFSDFECPFCLKVQPTVSELQKRYGNRVRWAFKNLPLEFHAKAKPAAYAAMAAHLQGKFTPYASKLWEGQAMLGDAYYVQAAKDLKLDMKKWEADRKSERVKAMVQQDMDDAQAIGARGTPFFLINGQPISGALPVEEFTKAIEAALTGRQK